MTTLHLLGAEQDIPRLLSGYVSLKGGEIAFVVRPGEATTVVCLHKVGKGKAATTEGHLAEQRVGAGVQKRAAVAQDCLAAIKAAKADPPSVRPTTIRGQWAGKVTATPMGERHWRLEVELPRNVASYGKVRITGSMSSVSMSLSWVSTLERKAQWFAEGKTTAASETSPRADLAETITDAYARMQGLVREACGVRDTTRRAAKDTAYAERHPIKPAKAKKDRLDLFLSKKRTPKPATTKPAQKALTESIQKDAAETVKAIEAVPKAARKQGEVAAVEDILEAWEDGRLHALRDHAELSSHYISGLPDLAEMARDYAASKLAPGEITLSLSDWQRDIKKRLWGLVEEDRKDNELTTAGAKASHAAAVQDLEHLVAAFRTAPALLARAGSLLKFAEAAIASPRCQGTDKDEAGAMLSRARAQLAAARSKLTDEGGLDAAGLRDLKRSVESIALSAGKAGRSCGAGQTSLLARPVSDPPAEATPKKARSKASAGVYESRGTFQYVGEGEVTLGGNRADHVWQRQLPAAVRTGIEAHTPERLDDGRRLWLEASASGWKLLAASRPYVMAEIVLGERLETEAEALQALYRQIQAEDARAVVFRLPFSKALGKGKDAAAQAARNLLTGLFKPSEASISNPLHGKWEVGLHVAHDQLAAVLPRLPQAKAALQVAPQQSAKADKPAKAPKTPKATPEADVETTKKTEVTPKKARGKRAGAAAAPAGTTDKDAILMSAFQQAIQAAVANAQQGN